MYKMPYSLAIHNNRGIKWNHSGFLKSRHLSFTSASEVYHKSGTFTRLHWSYNPGSWTNMLTQKRLLSREGMKIMSIFLSQASLWHNDSGWTERETTKGENTCQHMKTLLDILSKWRPYTYSRLQSNVGLTIKDVLLVNWQGILS